jgi:hypothetical protein
VDACRERSGGHSLFIRQKKVSKERAIAGKLPFGFALKWALKREMKQTRLRLRQVSFLIRFNTHFSASFHAHSSVRDHHFICGDML